VVINAMSVGPIIKELSFVKVTIEVIEGTRPVSLAI
jgi:hypothetical protein